MSESKPLIVQGLYEQLSEPLPDAAYIPDSSRGFTLTGIKAAFVTERLNDVFGLCGYGWKYVVIELRREADFVIARLELYWRANGNWSEPITAIGDTQIVKTRVGDAEKGAITDALKKAASLLGVGQLCYKGLVNPPRSERPSPSSTGKPPRHWIDDDRVRKRFWAWVKGTLQLTEDEIHEGLEVEHMRDVPWTMSETKAILEEFAIDRGAVG